MSEDAATDQTGTQCRVMQDTDHWFVALHNRMKLFPGRAIVPPSNAVAGAPIGLPLISAPAEKIYPAPIINANRTSSRSLIASNVCIISW